MNEMLLGAIAMGFFVAGLFFLRYWLSTRDRFFLYFTVSFFVEAGNRVNIAINHAWSEGSPAYYAVRLVAFGLIVLAIWDKNRSRR
jgi:hypothetical protein